MLINDSDVLIQSEDRACQQERLRHIIQQPASHIVNLDHLIRHQRDTAHDEQYRTGVLRDFEAFLVFHGLKHRFSCCTKNGSDNITDHLKDRSNCFTHNFTCFKW